MPEWKNFSSWDAVWRHNIHNNTFELMVTKFPEGNPKRRRSLIIVIPGDWVEESLADIATMQSVPIKSVLPWQTLEWYQERLAKAHEEIDELRKQLDDRR